VSSDASGFIKRLEQEALERQIAAMTASPIRRRNEHGDNSTRERTEEEAAECIDATDLLEDRIPNLSPVATWRTQAKSV